MEQRHKNDKRINIDSVLHRKLLTALEDNYLSLPKHTFTGYYGMATLLLIIYLYGHYARILSTELVENSTKMQEPFNPTNPIESLYTRINKCIEYKTTAEKLVTEIQVMRIAYDLVAKKGQFQ